MCRVLNYGSLGSILGHELTHGFDNTGRKFDYEGNENMWWTNQTIEEYEKRTTCFVNHYESYLLPGIEEKVFLILPNVTLVFNIFPNRRKVISLLYSVLLFIKMFYTQF